MFPRWHPMRLGVICILVILSLVELYQHLRNSCWSTEPPLTRPTAPELGPGSVAIEKQPPQPLSTNPLYSPNLRPNAYVFYATQDDYACSVLVNIDRLQSIFNTQYRIIVLVSTSVSEPIRKALTEHNATVIMHDVPPLADDRVPYYKDVLLKLVAFKLHILVPSLQRILVLDADQLVLKSLDHLFELPDTDLAAPRAYWINRDAISSTFMLVALSDRLWRRVREGMDTIQENTYDMDLINTMFGDVVMMLPGSFATMNGHWEAWDIPSWYQEKQATSTRWNSSVVASQNTESREHSESQNKLEKDPELERKLVSVYEQASVLHYTALGKPWSFTIEEAKELSPEAHPVFFEQFQTWQVSARKLCPGY